MASANHLVQVEIFGQSYNLRGEADPSYITELAEYVDGKMREVSSASTTVDSLKIAILAALNIADETRRQLKDRELREVEANEKLEGLVTMLDRCFEAPADASPGPGGS